MQPPSLPLLSLSHTLCSAVVWKTAPAVPICVIPQGTRELTKQACSLPQANYDLLRFICRFLNEVQSYASHNKMSIQNLATVFEPNILRPQMEDPVAQMEGTSLVWGLMAILVSEHGKIFDPARIQDSVQPEDDLQRPPSWLGWNLQSGQTENSLCSPICSLPPLRPSATKPHRQDCSQKGNQPASSPKPRKQGSSPGKGSGMAGPFYHPSRRSILGSCCFSFHKNWLVCGRSAVQGHLGGQGQDSDSCQRLSTYDNVPVLPLLEDARSNTSPRSSIASSGLSLTVDSVTPWAMCKTRACLALNLFPRDTLRAGPYLWRAAVVSQRQAVAEAGTNATCLLLLEMPITAQKPCKVSSLKVELQKQRSEYEITFRRREQASTGLKKLVTRLEEELIQEKKQQAMLEIKPRNSERARKDAEERNHFLQ